MRKGLKTVLGLGTKADGVSPDDENLQMHEAIVSFAEQ